jgi:hypothetical protein
VFRPFVELGQGWKGVMILVGLSRILARTSATGAFKGIKKVEQ